MKKILSLIVLFIILFPIFLNNGVVVFNPKNIIRYLDPKTTYDHEYLQEYSKALVVTGITIYCGYKLIKYIREDNKLKKQ